MWEQIKKIKEKLGIISTMLLMIFGVGIFGTIKYTINYVKAANKSITGHEILVRKVDSLEKRVTTLEEQLSDYDIIKQNVIYLMQDNDVLTGLLRANMEKMDEKDYGTVLILYDDVLETKVRRMVEVKMRRAKGSGDLYVFVPWGKLLGIPITKKFAAKWHEDEKKFYFIDKEGEFHLIYEVDIESTILK